MGVELRNANGEVEDVPYEQVQDKLATGNYEYRTGTKIPVHTSEGIVTYPIEQLQPTDQIASQQDYHKAIVENKYGDAWHGAEAAANEALNTVAGDIPNAIVGKYGPAGAGKRILEEREAHPVAKTAGMLAGLAIPALGELGAAGKGVEAANALGKGAEVAGAIGKGAEGASLAEKIIKAPTQAVADVGNFVERNIQKLVGTEATSTLGRAAQKAVPVIGKRAAENVLYGVANTIGESSLNDDPPDLLGEKLLHAVGYSALVGGVVGGVESSFGSLVSKGAKVAFGEGEHSEHADQQAVRAITTKEKFDRAFDRVGGSEAVGRRLLDTDMPAVAGQAPEKLMKIGQNVEDIAPRITIARQASGEKIGEMYDQVTAAAQKATKTISSEEGRALFEKLKIEQPQIPDAIHRAEVGKLVDNFEPKLSDVVRKFDTEILPELQTLRSLNKPAINQVERVKADLTRIAAKSESEFGEATVPYKELQKFRIKLDEQINFDRQSNVVNTTTEAMKGMRNAIEDVLTDAGDRAAKVASEHGHEISPGWAAEYKEQKLAHSQLRAAEKAADDAVTGRHAHRMFSPSDHGIGGVGAIAAAAAGHGGFMTAITGAVMGAAAKVVRERGNSTAAVILNKAHVTQGMVKAVTKFNKTAARIVGMVVSHHIASSLLTKEDRDLHGDFDKKSSEVLQAASQADGHASASEHAAAVGVVNPAAGAALESSTINKTIYLVNALPKAHIPQDSLQPLLDKHEPSDMAKSVWLDQYEGVNNPLGVVAGINDGTISKHMVDAMMATSAPLHDSLAKAITDAAAKTKKPIPYRKQVAIKIFLGKPVLPPDTFSLMQKSYAPSQGGGAGGGGKLPAGGGPAKNMSLGSKLG